MASSDNALQIQLQLHEEREEGTNTWTHRTKDEMYAKMDERIRTIFSMRPNERLEADENIQRNIPNQYQWSDRWYLLYNLAITLIQTCVFLSFFTSWIHKIRSNSVGILVLFCQIALPVFVLCIAAESIWRARYHYKYLSYHVVIVFDGKPYYKRKLFWFFAALYILMFIIGLYNDVGTFDLYKLEVTAFAAITSFLGFFLTVKGVLQLEESAMCKLHELIRHYASRQQLDEVFRHLLVVNATVFKAYVVNRKLQIAELLASIRKRDVREDWQTRKALMTEYPFDWWYVNRQDIEQFMSDEDIGSSVETAREYLSAKQVTGCCGWRELFWAVS